MAHSGVEVSEAGSASSASASDDATEDVRSFADPRTAVFTDC
jgi:hypothetical protein